MSQPPRPALRRSRTRRGPRLRVRLVAGVLGLSTALGLAACDGQATPPGPGAGSSGTSAPTSTAPQPVRLTFGAWGNPRVLGAYQRVIEQFDRTSPEARVTLRRDTSRQQLARQVRRGDAPDVFLASRSDLAAMLGKKLTQPVGDLLDERSVSFGDDYSRDALEAFSVNRQLQCMPYGVSPTVIFYNTRLVDFATMLRRGRDVPESPWTSWGIDQLSSAARFAVRRHPHAKAIYVPPTLQGLAPWVLAGGGSLFDDDSDPSSLDLSDDASREALTRTLGLLRDPRLTLTPLQLEEHTPLEWFERGKLAMIQGQRDLVPTLRSVPGLSFDVLPMPNFGRRTTLGDFTALCISRDTPHVNEAADLLAAMIQPAAVAEVVRAGSLVPASQRVALSPAFLQPGLQPEHASVINTAVRGMVAFPLLLDRDQLGRAVDPDVKALVDDPILDDLEQRLLRIDQASRAPLAVFGVPDLTPATQP